ncbi:hypothetical protein L1887_10784 [Cichorium endivia]|nr:hypothetical protein L1887_10784 [Cichorium endivia]
MLTNFFLLLLALATISIPQTVSHPFLLNKHDMVRHAIPSAAPAAPSSQARLTRPPHFRQPPVLLVSPSHPRLQQWRQFSNLLSSVTNDSLTSPKIFK